MKQELKHVVMLANDFSPDQLPGAEQYNREKLKRFEAQNEMPEYQAQNLQPRHWQDDPGEKSRRIWEWWRTLLNKPDKKARKKIGSFLECILIVALIQVSSADAERVFSCLKQVRDACGESLLESTLEVRIMKMMEARLQREK